MIRNVVRKHCDINKIKTLPILAENSIATACNLPQNSALIPTLATGSDKVKNRFYFLISHTTTLKLSTPTATSTPRIKKQRSSSSDDKCGMYIKDTNNRICASTLQKS
mgnify:FL=1